MKITKVSPLTGKSNTREINITPEKLMEVQSRQRCIQDVVPNLNADDREFLITGYIPEDWKSIFPDED